MSINSVALSGRLGADPALRYTAKGKSVLSFSLAVDEGIPDGNGGWTNRTNWFKCEIFGNRATSLQEYLHKGSKVTLEGKLRQRSWEWNGQKHSSVTVAVRELELCGGHSASEGTRSEAAEPAQYAYGEPEDGLYDEELPF